MSAPCAAGANPKRVAVTKSPTVKNVANRRAPSAPATRPYRMHPMAPPMFISIEPEMPPAALSPSSVSVRGVQLRRK